MILATRSDGDRELRMFELVGSFVPSPGTGEASWGGSVRTPALQIAAISCAVRLLSEEIASCVLRVYEGDAQERRPVLDAPQAATFQRPADGWTSFDVWSDIVASIELEKHAFLWKVVTGRGLQEIYPVDPACFRVRREKGTNRKIVEAWMNGRKEEVTEQVIHIRGWSPNAGPEGMATPDMHRQMIRTAAAYEEYRGAYFENDGTPGLVIEHPGKPDRQQRKDVLEAWITRHARPRNAGRVGIAWDGMKVTPLSNNLRDSQAAEVADVIVRDVARAWRIFPPELLHVSIQGEQAAKSAESWSDIFFRFSLLPRLRRIERAIAADLDAFPDPSLYPRFDVTEFVRGDVATTATLVHELVQVGVLTKNEGRALMGYAPIEGGDVLLETPVGGGAGGIGPDANSAPNPAEQNGHVDEPVPIP